MKIDDHLRKVLANLTILVTNIQSIPQHSPNPLSFSPSPPCLLLYRSCPVPISNSLSLCMYSFLQRSIHCLRSSSVQLFGLSLPFPLPLSVLDFSALLKFFVIFQSPLPLPPSHSFHSFSQLTVIYPFFLYLDPFRFKLFCFIPPF